MPQLDVAANPQLAKQILKDAMAEPKGNAKAPPPQAPTPSDLVFQLAGGYIDDPSSPVWIKDFEVRELTGRDEEYIGRIKDPVMAFATMLERGLVRVGHLPADREVVDGLMAGDWETALFAIRIATFGQEYEVDRTCLFCREEYKVGLDLTKDIKFKFGDKDGLHFEVVGRHGTKYGVTHVFGSTQRQIMALGSDASTASIATLILSKCVLKINGFPPLSSDTVRDIPLADRRAILKEIELRRVGPNLSEVTTKCPACGEEQVLSLNIAALFQG